MPLYSLLIRDSIRHQHLKKHDPEMNIYYNKPLVTFQDINEVNLQCKANTNWQTIALEECEKLDSVMDIVLQYIELTCHPQGQ